MLSLALFSLAVDSTRMLSRGSAIPTGRILAAGALIVALAYTRAPSALFTGLTLSLFLIALARPTFKRLGQIIAVSFVGGALFVVLTSLIVEPVPRTFLRLGGGLERLALFAEDGALAQSFDRFISTAAAAIGTQLVGLVLVAGASLGWFTVHVSAKFGRVWARAASTAAVMLSVLVLGWPQWARVVGSEQVGLLQQAQYAFPLFAGWALSAVAVGVTTQSRSMLRLVAILGVIALVWFGQAFGSSNNWFVFGGGLFASYGLLAVLTAVITMGARREVTPIILASAILIGAQAIAWGAMTAHPYRLPLPLAQQTEPVSVRTASNRLLVDRPTREFLEALRPAQEQISLAPQRPMLIDLSAGTPLVNYHLGARPTGLPWILGGYPASQEQFEWVLDSISQEELCRAWLVLSPDSGRRLDPAPIWRRGMDRSEDYREVVRAYAPYPGAELIVLAPLAPDERCFSDPRPRTGR